MARILQAKHHSLITWGDGRQKSYAESTPGLKLWDPGHWMRYNGYGASGLSARQSAYSLTTGISTIKGAVLFALWGILEPSLGTYFWTDLDAEISYLDSIGKKAIIDVYPLGYSDSVPSTPQSGERKFAPDYAITNGWVGNLNYGGGFTGPGWGARLDITACNTRYLALLQAIADRYNNDARVVAVMTGETSVNVGLGGSGTNYTNYLTEWQRLATTAPGYFSKKFVYILNNGMDNVARTQSLMDSQFAGLAGQSRPDILGYSLTDESWGDYAARGAGYVPGVGTFGTTDYRGRIPIAAEQQVIRGEDKVPADALYVANTYRKASMLVWTIFNGYNPTAYGTSTPVPAFRWDGLGGVVAWLSDPSRALTNVAYPTLV